MRIELRKTDGKPTVSDETATDTTLDVEEKPDKWLVCRLCLHEIAKTAAAIPIRGSHQHTHVNPEGHVYEIRCFADAPGCITAGDRYTYWTWFSGYSWQIVVCGECTHHLGWLFESGSDGFYGLIAQEVIEL